MIIRGGENVYPREIEEVIADHPAVAGIQVIGIDDDRWGEQVGVVVVLRPGQEAGPAEIFGWARDRLPPTAAPQVVRGERVPDDGQRQGPEFVSGRTSIRVS